MAEEITLSLEPRTLTGKKVNRLRRAGILPATVYGKGVGPFVVQLNARGFNDMLRRTGRTALLKLEIPGQQMLSAFIHVLQRHPVTRDIIHVDFHAVDLNVEMTTSVAIHLVGESPLVARGDALLNHTLTSLEVRALPAQLPSAIEVDISGLDSFEKTIHVRDIAASGSYTIETSGDELVVNLSQARDAAEDAEGAAPAEPELVRDQREDSNTGE